MRFKVTTAVEKLLKLTKRKRVIQGGTSAGKTVGILPILIDKAIREPMSEISVVSESVPHLRRGAYKDFLKLMVSLNRFNDSQLNKSTMTYTFTNGSYIEFFSVEQSDKLRGARRTDLYINEANNISFDAYKQLSIRTSGTIWIDFNPTSRFWAHDEVLKDNDSELLVITYKDNEALPQTIVDEIESAKEKGKDSEYWANWYNVYGLGKIGSLQGACITEWSEIDSLPKEAKLVSAGLDFGFTNDASSLISVYKYNGQYIVDEVFYQKGLLNSEIGALIKDSNLEEICIYADSSEPKSIAELKTYGINIDSVSKGRDSIVYGINLINQEGILVTKRSKNLIKELGNYIWKVDKTGATINVPIDAFNHCIDALRYAIVSLLENKHKGEYHIWF